MHLTWNSDVDRNDTKTENGCKLFTLTAVAQGKCYS